MANATESMQRVEETCKNMTDPETSTLAYFHRCAAKRAKTLEMPRAKAFEQHLRAVDRVLRARAMLLN